MIDTVSNPTEQTYGELMAAFSHFNRHLFNGEVPHVLITLQRKAKARGYAAQDRFGDRDDSVTSHELALNPSAFKDRTVTEILSTLVHEMVHIWQFHCGNPGRGRYHNAEWAGKMEAVGLIPSDTGKPGGKRTGDRVTHYILADGPFALSCAAFLEGNTGITFIERWGEKKWEFRQKTKFTCPTCRANAWGKPDLDIWCGPCNAPMAASRLAIAA